MTYPAPDLAGQATAHVLMTLRNQRFGLAHAGALEP